MPRPTRIITDLEKREVADRVQAGASEDDLAAYLNMPVERVKRMFRRDLEYHTADAKHQVLSKLYDAAKSGTNTTAAVFWAKARYGWRDTGTRDNTTPMVWPRLIVDIDGAQPSC